MAGRKGLIAVVVLGMSTAAFAQFGSSLGNSLGNAATNAAKGAATSAAVGVVEKQINNKLAGLGCQFKDKTTDPTCDLTKVLAELKVGHTLAENNRTKHVDFNVNTTVCGKGDLLEQRATKMESKLKLLFKGWDSTVNRGGKGNCLDFSVDLD